jgi:hypothetical protein
MGSLSGFFRLAPSCAPPCSIVLVTVCDPIAGLMQLGDFEGFNVARGHSIFIVCIGSLALEVFYF